ncbi:MAG: DUF2079 domain-containing protein [Anaerolineaceae bacterium]|nr:DUF2079 domain-containing protein [Anaerolineaceae bacterium]
MMNDEQGMMNHQTQMMSDEHETSLIIHHSSFIILVFLIAVFAIFFSALSVQQHRAFLTNGLDLGNVDQALWNTAQGHFLQFTLMAPVASRLALHVEPILLFFVPFYWLNLGRPELLLIVQATVVALGAWPLYQIVLIHLAPSPSPTPTPQSSTPISPLSIINYQLLIIPLAYLLLPTLQSAVLFDFHAVTMAPTFLLFAFLALERQQDRRFLIFAALAMACKEDMPLTVAMLGLYTGLARRRWRLAGLTIAISAVWFGLAFFVIQPRFAAGGNIQLDRYAWLGDDPPSMLVTLVTNPQLVFDHLWTQVNLSDYLFDLFFPAAFLALLSPLTLIPMLPTLAVNLLSDNPFTWRLEDFHYGAPLAPFLFIAAIYGIRRLAAWKTHQNQTFLRLSLSLLLLICSIIYHYHRGYTPLARPFHWPEVTTHHHLLETILADIPSGAPVFAQSNLAPHLSQREILYSDFGYFTDPHFPAKAPVTDILLDVTRFENIGSLHQFLQETFGADDNYQLVAAEDGILHLKAHTSSQFGKTESAPSSLISNLQPPASTPPSPTSNPPSPISNLQLPTPFFSFTQSTSPLVYTLPVDFGDVLRLHGYTLHFNRQEEIQVTVDLEARQPLESIRPVLYLLDSTGQPLGATEDLQPTLVWYPVEQWPVGQMVRLRFNTIPWYTRSMPAYRLALGVISGDDVWDVSRRHLPALYQPTEFALRRPADGTLIELARIEQNWSMPVGGPVFRRFEPPRLPQRLDANFDAQVRLLGYRDLTQLTEQDATVSLTLVWQAISAPENLIRFVQVIGPDGLVYGQQDSMPDTGQYPPSLWQPGEVVVESIAFPVKVERPPGHYTLHIGLYRPATGERLPLELGGDHVTIAIPD